MLFVVEDVLVVIKVRESIRMLFHIKLCCRMQGHLYASD